MRVFSSITRVQNKSFKVILGSTTIPHEHCHLLQFDGGANPNPGPASAGAVIFGPEERKFVYEQGVFIDHASNNEAEYRALVVGLEAAKDLGIKNLLIEGDSQLIVEQISGSYKIKSTSLMPLYKSARKLMAQNFEFVGIRHIYRESNTYADGITKYILQTKSSYIEEMASTPPYSSSAC